MKNWQAAAWAVGGAVLAVAAIYTVPALHPDGEADESEAAAAKEQPFGVVETDAQMRQRADIQIAPLHTASTGAVREGYARALDLSGLAAINADYRAAVAAAEASAKEAARQKALFAADTSTSARAVDQARAQATADAEKVKLACRRVSLEYGPGLERLGCPALDALLRDATAGRAALLRLDFAGGSPPAGSRVTLSGAGAEAVVRVLGPAAMADQSLQTSGALALLRGAGATRFGVGKQVDASVSAGGATRSGAVVPRSAILRADGALWVYRAVTGDRFERIELKNAQATPAGWFVPAGLQSGERIVVSGAGTLLGLERGSAGEGEE